MPSGVIAAVHLMGSLGEKSRADHARNDDRESENSECYATRRRST
jgi:hypothetical protein